MGLIDAFTSEDRVDVTFSTFAHMTKEAVKLELLMNAVNCNIPYRYIREMVTGQSEEPVQDIFNEEE